MMFGAIGLLAAFIGYLLAQNKNRKEEARSLQQQIDFMRIEVHNISRHYNDENKFRGHFPS